MILRWSVVRGLRVPTSNSSDTFFYEKRMHDWNQLNKKVKERKEKTKTKTKSNSTP